MAEIKIVIKDGKANIEVEGLEGVSCTELTSILQKELGCIEETNYKSEYYNETEELEIQVNE